MTKCRRTVLTIILDENYKLLSKGQNIAGCEAECTNPPGVSDGVCNAIHSEIVAINNLKKTDKPYYALVSWPPCDNCRSALNAIGIERLYVKS